MVHFIISTLLIITHNTAHATPSLRGHNLLVMMGEFWIGDKRVVGGVAA